MLNYICTYIFLYLQTLKKRPYLKSSIILGKYTFILHSQCHGWWAGDAKSLGTRWVCGAVVINRLSHWGRVTHICSIRLIIISSANGLSPGRRQASSWTNDWILLIEPLGTTFSEISIAIITFSFKKNAFENDVCEMAASLCRPHCDIRY